MATLTTYLESSPRADNPTDPDLCHLLKPTGLVMHCYRECSGCQHNATHRTYHHGKLTQALPSASKISLQQLRQMQWAVYRANRDTYQLEGSVPGYIINGAASYNFADAISWKVVSAEEKSIVLEYVADPRNIVLFAYRYSAEDGFGYITSTSNGVLQPNDELEFMAPSSLAGRVRPSVVGITACDYANKRVTALLDKDVSMALHNSDPTLTDPTIYVKSWRACGDPEKWLQINPGDPFPGQKIVRRITAESIPSDGIYELLSADGTSTCVPYPHGPTEVRPQGVFHVKGRDATGAWVDITAACRSRLYVETYATTPTTYRTRLCLGAVDINGNTITDLRSTYSAFRISYCGFASAACIAAHREHYPAHRRCRWSRYDRSNSVQHYGAPNGTGTGCYCAMRRYAVETPVYETDPQSPMYGLQTGVTVTWAQPTGIAGYPADGRCMMYNTCDKYEPLEGYGPAQDPEVQPFSVRYTFARWYRDICASADFYIQQLMPGFGDYRNMQVVRARHPSLASLLGDWTISTPSGMHPWYWHRTWGIQISKYEAYDTERVVGGVTYTDTRLRSTGLYAWDEAKALAAVDMADSQTYPGLGYVGTHVSGWSTQHNPVDYASTIASGHPCRAGFALMRDTGAQTGRGYHRYTHVVPNDETLYLPLVDLGQTDEAQDMVDTTIRIWPSDERPTVLGQSIGATITVKPLRSCLKTPALLNSGHVFSVTSLGNHRYKVVLENGPHCYSYIAGSSGDRFDYVYSWYGGGSFILPPTWARINSYYEPDNQIGDTRARCSPCDTVAFDVEGLEDKRFLVLSTAAHAETPAATWGAGRIVRVRTLPGYWEAADAAILLDTGAYGPITALPIVTQSAYAANATTITLAAPIQCAYGVLYRVVRTGELIYVNSYDAETYELTVTRGYLSGLGYPAAAAINVGDVMEWIALRAADDSQPLLSAAYPRPVARPRELSAQQYWVDQEVGRIYVGAAIESYSVWHGVQGQDLDATGVHSSNGNTAIPAYSEWVTDIDDDYAGNDIEVLYTDPADGGVLERTYSSSPSVGEYFQYDSNGVLVFRFHINDAGRNVKITVTLEEDAADPGDGVCGVPGYSTTQWGRRRDSIVVVDEAGWLEDAGLEALDGAVIDAYASGGVWLPTGAETLQVTEPYTDTWTTVSGVIWEHGRGMIHVPAESMAGWPETPCVRITNA